MTRVLLPYLALPTRETRLGYLDAVYHAGWNWNGLTLGRARSCHGEPGEDGDRQDSFPDSTLIYMTRYGNLLFGRESDVQDEVESERDVERELVYMLVNSPAHFISFGRSIWAANHEPAPPQPARPVLVAKLTPPPVASDHEDIPFDDYDYR